MSEVIPSEGLPAKNLIHEINEITESIEEAGYKWIAHSISEDGKWASHTWKTPGCLLTTGQSVVFGLEYFVDCSKYRWWFEYVDRLSVADVSIKVSGSSQDSNICSEFTRWENLVKDAATKAMGV